MLFDYDIEGRRHLSRQGVGLTNLVPGVATGRGLSNAKYEPRRGDKDPFSMNLLKTLKSSNMMERTGFQQAAKYQRVDMRLQASTNQFLQRTFNIEKTYFTKASRFIDEERKSARSKVSAETQYYRQEERHTRLHIRHMTVTERHQRDLLRMVHILDTTGVNMLSVLHGMADMKGSKYTTSFTTLPGDPSSDFMTRRFGKRPSRLMDTFRSGVAREERARQRRDIDAQRALQRRGFTNAELQRYEQKGMRPHEVAASGVSNRSFRQRMSPAAMVGNLAHATMHPILTARGIISGFMAIPGGAMRAAGGIARGIPRAMRAVGGGVGAIAGGALGALGGPLAPITIPLGAKLGGALGRGIGGSPGILGGMMGAMLSARSFRNRDPFHGIVHGAAGIASMIPGLGPVVGAAIESIAHLIPEKLRNSFNEWAGSGLAKMWTSVFDKNSFVGKVGNALADLGDILVKTWDLFRQTIFSDEAMGLYKTIFITIAKSQLAFLQSVKEYVIPEKKGMGEDDPNYGKRESFLTILQRNFSDVAKYMETDLAPRIKRLTDPVVQAFSDMFDMVIRKVDTVIQSVKEFFFEAARKAPWFWNRIGIYAPEPSTGNVASVMNESSIMTASRNSKLEDTRKEIDANGKRIDYLADKIERLQTLKNESQAAGDAAQNSRNLLEQVGNLIKRGMSSGMTYLYDTQIANAQAEQEKRLAVVKELDKNKKLLLDELDELKKITETFGKVNEERKKQLLKQLESYGDSTAQKNKERTERLQREREELNRLEQDPYRFFQLQSSRGGGGGRNSSQFALAHYTGGGPGSTPTMDVPGILPPTGVGIRYAGGIWSGGAGMNTLPGGGSGLGGNQGPQQVAVPAPAPSTRPVGRVASNYAPANTAPLAQGVPASTGSAGSPGSPGSTGGIIGASARFLRITPLALASESAGGQLGIQNPRPSSKALGKYQFMPFVHNKPGSLHDVFNFFKNNSDPNMKEIGERLAAGGTPGTPGFTRAWQAIAQDGRLRPYFEAGQDIMAEKLYYKDIDPLMENRSPLARAVAFVTSLHTGAGNTKDFINSNLLHVSDEDFIDQLYKMRLSRADSFDKPNVEREYRAVMRAGADPANALSTAVNTYNSGRNVINLPQNVGGRGQAPDPPSTKTGASGIGGVFGSFMDSLINLHSSETIQSLIGSTKELATKGMDTFYKGTAGLGTYFGKEYNILQGKAKTAAANGELPGVLGSYALDMAGALGADAGRWGSDWQSSPSSYGGGPTGYPTGSGTVMEDPVMHRTLQQLNTTMQQVVTKEDPLKNAMYGHEDDIMVKMLFFALT